MASARDHMDILPGNISALRRPHGGERSLEWRKFDDGALRTRGPQASARARGAVVVPGHCLGSECEEGTDSNLERTLTLRKLSHADPGIQRSGARHSDPAAPPSIA